MGHPSGLVLERNCNDNGKIRKLNFLGLWRQVGVGKVENIVGSETEFDEHFVGESGDE